MAKISSRASVFSMMKETTEGTPVSPTGATSFIALQDDYQLNSAFDTVENAELTGTIGQAKPTLGAENPTASFSHYLRGSGTEGVAADYSELMEGLFGEVVVTSTEDDTVGGSTTTVINVNTGEGADYPRGRALLIKDGTNGYSIRNTFSTTGDAITLGHALSVAPAAGVNLGKPVTYNPTNASPSYTLWEYEGNGGLIQMISGSKVESLSASIDPENFINSAFNLQGVNYYFDPIRVSATDTFIDFDDGAVQVASVTAKVYRSPGELASAIQTAMNQVSSGITVTYSSSTGKFTIAKASGTLELLWNTGANAANTIGDVLGFSTAADDTGFLTYTADNAQNYAAPYTPTYDSANPVVGKNMEAFLGTASDIACFGVRSINWDFTNTLVNVPDICEESGRSGKLKTVREVTFTIVASVNQYDVSKYEAFKAATDLRLVINFGEKSGGNWVAGKCANIFSPSCVLSSFEIDKVDDTTIANMTVTCFVANGLGEIYYNTL